MSERAVWDYYTSRNASLLCDCVAQSLVCCFIQRGCQAEFGGYRRGDTRSSGRSHQQKRMLQSSASAFSGEDPRAIKCDIRICRFSLRMRRGFFIFKIIDEADRMIDSMQQSWLNQVTKAVYKSGCSSGVSIFSRVEPGPITVAR